MTHRSCPQETGRSGDRTGALLAQGRRAALELLERLPLEEEPMNRYAPPRCCPPPPPCPGGGPGLTRQLDRILEELARQNQLLTELLGAVNALNAAALSIRGRMD